MKGSFEVTNIMAKWSLVHVGRKRKPAPIIGATLPEEEEFRALDDKEKRVDA